MELNQLQSDDSAVSPVIGVILMVAITVILAAVIASFVLGLSPGTSTTPTASFSSEFASGELTITMNSGESISSEKLSVSGPDSSGSTVQRSWTTERGGSTILEAGSSITVGEDGTFSLSTGDTVRLVYSDGDTSSTMQTFDL